MPVLSSPLAATTVCLNPAKEANDRLDTQVEVRVYPCNNNSGNVKKKFSQFSVKPEVSCFGVFIIGVFVYHFVVVFVWFRVFDLFRCPS